MTAHPDPPQEPQAEPQQGQSIQQVRERAAAAARKDRIRELERQARPRRTVLGLAVGAAVVVVLSAIHYRNRAPRGAEKGAATAPAATKPQGAPRPDARPLTPDAGSLRPEVAPGPPIAPSPAARPLPSPPTPPR